MHQESLPFHPLGPSAILAATRRLAHRLAALVNEVEWIVVILIGEFGQIFENGMRSDTAEPVFRIAKIAFAAVHDAMPKTTFWRLDALADRVALVEFTNQQPHSAQA